MAERSRETSRVARAAFLPQTGRVFPRLVLVFSWLLFVAALDAAEGAANPAAPAPGEGAPRIGENFTLAEPGLAMIWVSPGKFLMSSPHGAGDDTWVTLSRGYWLGRTEVTQYQWQAIMDRVPIPSHFRGSDRPVERVAWPTVAEFCQKLTERERAAGRLPDGWRYTLPTEAQWEFACRAGTDGKYAGDLEAMAWYEANSGEQSHPVAQKQPNAWGFYDMHGNVFEWCADWYRGYPGGEVSDPTGPAAGQFRVLRGGSWFQPAGWSRSSFRFWHTGEYRVNHVGFRLALAFAPPSAAK